jgi:hypothetical protein
MAGKSRGCIIILNVLSTNIATLYSGKTTLLKFIAARRLPVPPGVDVLLVQQEVFASEVSVVEQVCLSTPQHCATHLYYCHY